MKVDLCKNYTHSDSEVPEKIVEKVEVAKEQTLEIPSLEQLLEEVDNHNQVVQTTLESPYDTESEIKFVKSFLTNHLFELHDQTMNDYEVLADIQDNSDSDLHSMPDDELRSVLEFETADSDDFHDNNISTSDHVVQDDYAFAERLSILDHMDHICEEVSSLHSRLEDLESSIAQKVFDEIHLSLPTLITNALKEHLPRILSATLKDCLPLIVKESLQTHIPAASEQFAETQTQLNKKVVKQINRQFNISHVVQKGVHEDLQSQTKHISKYCSSFQNMQTQLQDVQDLLESAGELAYKESTLLVSETKVNEESAMVLYECEKKDLVDLTTEQDLEDDDDLDTHPLSKRFKSMHPILSKPQPSVKQFTDQLFKTTSLKFSPAPPREPTHLRDESKGKGIAAKEPLKDIIPFMEEGGPEMKRLADLKEHEKKSEEELKKLLNPATFKAKRLGLPPPPELATFGLNDEEKKRKRSEFLREVFMTKDVRVDGMNMNLIPPPRVVPIKGLVIKELESRIFFMNMNTDLAFQRENEFHLTHIVQLIWIQNQIKVDSEIANEIFRTMNYVIEARDDCIKAR
ncbi:hypothetical protein Tco_0542421 [Tanacetum coccineum]